MSNAAETAVARYVALVTERDAEKRRQLLEQCFAEDARIVTRSGPLVGHAAIGAMLARFVDDPENLGVRITSVVDARGTTFRFRAVTDRRDGTMLEVFDAGEIDAAGRISVLLTFPGPLADA